MIPILVLIAVTVSLIVAYLILSRKPKETYLATAEYWVYLPGEKLPPQAAIMTRMFAQNPYVQDGVSPIGQAEGLVFSDIRLHIALVRRSINAHVFRPDLFQDVEVTAEQLQALSEAQSFVKVRFTSEEPLKDKRHIQFLIHAADAYAAVGKGTLIYDVVAEKMLSREELQETLASSIDATDFRIHTRCLWKLEPHGGRIETRGLKKIGHKELTTPTVEADERMLVTTVMEEACGSIWDNPEVGCSVEVDTYLDRFQVLLEKSPEDPNPVRILRIQET